MNTIDALTELAELRREADRINQRRRELAQMAKHEGASLRTIAEWAGVSHQTVANWTS